MKTYKFRHWKTGEEISIEGEEVPTNPLSDRIVIQKEDGTFEDILKSTLVE